MSRIKQFITFKSGTAQKDKVPETVKFPGLLNKLGIRLSLGELGGAAGGLETVLLALLHSGVAGKEAGGLESGTISLVDLEEGAGYAVTDGAGLAGDPAAGDGGVDIDLAAEAYGLEGLTDDELKGVESEIIVEITAVDGDLAGAGGEEVDSRDGRLSSSGAVHIGLLRSIHYILPPYSSVQASGFWASCLCSAPA